jgi:hypothetical protein
MLHTRHIHTTLELVPPSLSSFHPFHPFHPLYQSNNDSGQKIKHGLTRSLISPAATNLVRYRLEGANESRPAYRQRLRQATHPRSRETTRFLTSFNAHSHTPTPHIHTFPYCPPLLPTFLRKIPPEYHTIQYRTGILPTGLDLDCDR